MKQRFVILEHDHPVLHWDLMFDVGDVLRTWRLERAPVPEVRLAAIAIADHRRQYLDYEGPVSGGRGTVTRWDAGTYDGLCESDGSVTAVVEGERLRGTMILQRPQDVEEWQFVFHPEATCES